MEAWRPPEKLVTSQWAEKHRWLSSESAAEASRFRNPRAPYQRGMMDACHEPGINRVVYVTSSQVGKTTIVENILGRFCHIEPCPIICLLPTVDKAKEFSKERFSPMVRDTPVLRDLFGDPKSRDGSNTILTKSFGDGGHIAFVGSNAPSGLASRPRRILLADEIDRMQRSAGVEGDPLKLILRRLANYFNSLAVMTSTPGLMSDSKIWREFLASDQRYFNVPCPRCGAYIVLEYKQLKWEKENDLVIPESVHYECQECSGVVQRSDQHLMLQHGKWIPTQPTRNVAGFHYWAIGSPWTEWVEIAEDRESCGKDPDQLKVFYNTWLGLPWEEKGEVVDFKSLFLRREEYAAQIPASVVILTAGVDTQDDRLEVTVYGWAPGEESYAIEHFILEGDPDDKGSFDDPNVWMQLDEILFGGQFKKANGRSLPVYATCIDSGGHRTTAVYKYCRRRASKNVFPIKGMAGNGREIIGQPARSKSGQKNVTTTLWLVGVWEARSIIYSRLKMDEPGPGYIHFPKHPSFGENFFKQLTSMVKLPAVIKGTPTTIWKMRQGRSRKESLDCFEYAFAALRKINPNWEAWLKRDRAMDLKPAQKKEERQVFARRAGLKPRRGFVKRGLS